MVKVALQVKVVLGALGALAGANFSGTVHSGCNCKALGLTVQQHELLHCCCSFAAVAADWLASAVLAQPKPN